MTIGSRARVALCVALAMFAGLVVPTALASTPAAIGQRAEMQRILDALREQYTAPGVGFTFGDWDGDATLSSGTRDVVFQHPIESTDRVRVGSDTKMFVAAVVLQLVTEGRIELDSPIERYLPGVLRYPADKVPGDPASFDGRTVTVRQLLQHTSGVPDYGSDLAYVLNPMHQVAPPRYRDHVAHAVRNGPTHEPGAAFSYSNTGYALLGMLVEATTGRSLSAEIAERIVEPLGLEGTFFPDPGEKGIPGSHVRGYLTQLVPLDLTHFEPAVWGAAGALVSTPDDMNKFISALLVGEVVAPAELAEMQSTVPYGTAAYGLGIVRVPLSCGMAWGHAGFLAGYQTFGLGLPNGRHAFLTINATYAVSLSPPPNPVSAYDLFELALC